MKQLRGSLICRRQKIDLSFQCRFIATFVAMTQRWISTHFSGLFHFHEENFSKFLNKIRFENFCRRLQVS